MHLDPLLSISLDLPLKHVGKWKQRWKGGCGMMGAEETATNYYAEVKLETEYEEVE